MLSRGALIFLTATLAACTFNPGAGNGTKVNGGGGTTGLTGSAGSGLRGGTGTGASNGTTGAGGDTPTEDANCGVKTNSIQAQPPDLLIVLDRSQSMTMAPDGTNCTAAGCSKWDQMSSAIEQVVSMATTVRWGIKYFSNSGGRTGGNCTVNANVAVGVGDATGPMIVTSIMGTMPGGSTPTRLAINSAVTYLQGLTDTNPKYILLATDGLPNCAPGANTMADDSAMTVMAIGTALTAGIPTFVVGIGDVPAQNGVDGPMTLMNMAQAGGRAPTAAPGYYQVNTTSDLVGVLNTIQGMVASCVFPLSPAPPDPTNIAVHADGMTIPKDTSNMNGWNYVGTCSATQTTPCSIQLFGSWCDGVTSKKYQNVEALYGCPGGPPVP
jgi:hypothetical protein